MTGHDKSRRGAGKKILADLPPQWPLDLLPKIKSRLRCSPHKVVVLDDDPTGTQTVHGIPVLTGWSVDELKAELAGELQAFYVLTNTRSCTLERARSINAEIGRNLKEAARGSAREFVVVSRSDSTLRGHFPGEVDALAEGLERKFDAVVLAPFFPEGGRFTIGDIHYVQEGELLVPAAETEFARDPVFGYRSSDLRLWVEEKTGGRISHEAVVSLSVEDLRAKGPDTVAAALSGLREGVVCVVNAAAYRDMEVFVLGLLEAERRGRRFLYRTAASFARVRSGLSERPLLDGDGLDLPEEGGALFLVGSHVPKTTRQLNALLAHPGTRPFELSVEKLCGGGGSRRDEIDRVARSAEGALRSGKNAAIYTSRRLVTGKDPEATLSIGGQVSAGMVACLQKISARPRYIVAKGGITSSDVATGALNVRRAMVAGQIQPGVPVWKLGAESRFPGLAYVVFPGNVGDRKALVDVVRVLEKRR